MIRQPLTHLTIYLFTKLNSTAPLSSVNIASTLVSLIKEADPDSAPKAHEARAYASTLAFLHSHTLDTVREGGQWEFNTAFLTHYLRLEIQDTPCVAMGTLPQVH